ncbi:hypothetical protein KDA_27410 [Dictyobacter alpinus]|uniref:DUF4097 domain-containing protein n=1 Tax=Dictyobacter alpinus TaxID=2014873 RepID=A0A402B7F7_9CHLR|nr:DUF4097 family beta strand repeat-containing protein [Dictyobacter alpinus]GCE27257.1 hypothetical protein KDA_27410 [Dictyobacter alpinus]
MQSQEDQQSSQGQEYAPTSGHMLNTDPREQPSPQQSSNYTYQERSYEEGYSNQNFYDDPWFQDNAGEKLRPQSGSQRGISTIFMVLGALLLGVLIGHFVGIVGGWFFWPGIAVLALIAIFVIYSNWHVITIPLPMERFQIQEHARLTINNTVGSVSIRRGEQNEVTVTGTKRASGPWITSKNMLMNYDQRGDELKIKSEIHWSPLQFGLRSIDLEITVPQHCDIQLKNGSGKIDLQNISGAIKARTGSGSIIAHGMQGQMQLKSGSGSIEVDDLSGRIELNTGSGHVTANQLNGEVMLRTGSGSIEGTDITGRGEIKTGSGRITLTRSILSGNTNIHTGSGQINFSGAIEPLGDYTLHTGSGSISLTLPTQSAFNLKAHTGSGRVDNAFGNNQAGSDPRAQLTLHTGSGSITIQKSF